MSRKQRYNIVIRGSQNRRTRRPFFWNREPLRPNAVGDEFIEAVTQQWDHLTFGGKYASEYKGFDFRGNMVPDGVGAIEKPGSVWMWGLGTALVITVERAP